MTEVWESEGGKRYLEVEVKCDGTKTKIAEYTETEYQFKGIMLM